MLSESSLPGRISGEKQVPRKSLLDLVRPELLEDVGISPLNVGSFIIPQANGDGADVAHIGDAIPSRLWNIALIESPRLESGDTDWYFGIIPGLRFADLKTQKEKDEFKANLLAIISPEHKVSPIEIQRLLTLKR